MLQVEFNKAALSLSDAIPTDQRKAALNRLLKARPACPTPLRAPPMEPCGHAGAMITSGLLPISTFSCGVFMT